MSDQRTYGAIEIGGTKIICAVGTEDGTILERTRFPTSSPETDVPRMTDFFSGSGISSLGVGTFGPVDLRGKGDEYGRILECPREKWSGCPLGSLLRNALKVPVAVDSDVNAACIGEASFGAGKGKENVLYITVGTGIGIGFTIDGRPLHGLMHPEGGHSKVMTHPGETISSVCRFHPDCAEGFASGPALERRCGKRGESIPKDDPVWEIEAYYLSQLVRNCMQILSPNAIVMGGGVMEQSHLFPMVRDGVREQLHGHYVRAESADLDTYIVPSLLGGSQALLGCIRMASEVFGHPLSHL